MKVCYKKDSKGKIRITSFRTEGHIIIMESGLLDGKKIVKEVPCKAKNIGKSNETTAEQQAQLEMLSRYNKKIDEGYFETIEEAKNNLVILPMLAHTCNLSSLKYPVILSPKLDGMRCLGNVETPGGVSTLKSRKGKTIETLPHIKLPYINQNVYIDGELYSHEDDFQTNMSLIKKFREGETDKKIKFHIYDVYVKDSKDDYKSRHSFMSDMLDSTANVNCLMVPYVEVNNEEELKLQHIKYLEHGYEGTMVRINDVPYELNKRSHSLLKYKDFIDDTYTIIDVVPNDKSPEHGTIVCKLGNGETFKCGMRMSHKEREELLLNKEYYIGRTAEVRFFEYSSDKVPRFPVCVGIRLDK